MWRLPSAAPLLAVAALTQLRATEVNIVVSDSGTDDRSCIEGHHHCYTLSYVLNETLNTTAPSGGSTSVQYLVNVTSDQLMPSASYYTTGSVCLVVQGVGHPRLSCMESVKDTYISFSGDGRMSLTWSGIQWNNFSVDCRDRDPYLMAGPSPAVLLAFSYIHDIFFSSCTISQVSGTFFFHEVGSVTFDGCNITNNDLTQSNSCMSVGAISPKQNGLILFTVEKSTKHDYAIVQSFFYHNLGRVSSGALISYHQLTYKENHLEVMLTIDRSHFIDNTNLTLLNIVDEVQGPVRGSLLVLVLDGKFIANTCTFTACVKFKINHLTENFTAGLTIQRNTFDNNTVIRTIDYNSLIHVSVQSEFISSVLFTTNFSDIQFTENTGALISVYNMFRNRTQLLFSNISIHSNRAEDYLIQVMCRLCEVEIDAANVTDNTVYFFHSQTKRVAIIDIQAKQVALARSTFANNIGTAIAFENSCPKLREYVQFRLVEDVYVHGNRGLYGGGIVLTNARISSGSNYSNVLFQDNVAIYGGAIYFSVTFVNGKDDCLVDNITMLSGHNFVNNVAGTSGQSLFIEASQCQCFQSQGTKIPPEMVSSTPTNITLAQHSLDDLAVFPGKEIMLNLMVKGCFNSPSSCLADVALMCNNHRQILCEYDGVTIQLQGPPTVFLKTGKTDFGLSITTSSLIPNSNISLPVHLYCQGHMSGHVVLPLRLVTCPYGLVFNNKSNQCECVQLSNKYLCSAQIGIVCVHNGHWLGMVNDDATMQNVLVLHPCDLPFCNSSNLNRACPSSLSGGTSGYILLEWTQDTQCLDNRGGVLCRSCTANNTFTFVGTECIEEDVCKFWHPYLLLVLAIGFQLMLAFLLIMALKLQLRSGSGYLYGPLFFLSVVTHIPLVSNVLLKTTISIFSSVLLVNLEVLGYIPWCFFSLSPLEHFSFRFLGPAVILVVLVMVLVMAQACPRWFAILSKSPVQAICFLILVCFWSLADTSLQIVAYIDFSDSGCSGTRVSLEPELAYLTGIHIPFWILAMLILVLFIFPFILFLFLAPFLAIRYNLNLVKPFLDEFQSCYCDNYHWYSAVYFAAWILLRSLLIANQDALVLTGLVVLASAQIAVFPYSSRWLNVADSLLLGDLVVLDSINQEDQSTGAQVLLHFLILAPLAYIMIGGVCLILQQTKCIACIRKLMSRPLSKSVNSPESAVAVASVTRTIVSIDDASCEEREPLLQFMADQN